MKKTNKPNPLKTFNDNKAMAYKKAGGEMKAFKKSLMKGQNGMAVDSAYKASQMMEPNSRTNVDIRNKELVSKMPAPTGQRPDYVKIKEGAYAKGNMGNDSFAPKPNFNSKPNNPKVNYREEIQKKYGTGPDGNLTPEDIMKLKAQGIFKKGGLVKRKK